MKLNIFTVLYIKNYMKFEKNCLVSLKMALKNYFISGKIVKISC